MPELNEKTVTGQDRVTPTEETRVKDTENLRERTGEKKGDDELVQRGEEKRSDDRYLPVDPKRGQTKEEKNMIILEEYT